MKRVSLVLDEELLEKAVQVAGVKTDAAAVDLALRDFVRRAEARQILELRGSCPWEGDRSERRADPPRRRS